MSFLVNIPYLQADDVTPSGELKPHVTKGKQTVVMLQGNFCGYCTKAKPAFQALLNNGKFNVATVQTDGDQTETAAAQLLGKYNTSGGVPCYLGFDSQGKFRGMYQGNRDTASLIEFGSKL